MMFSKGIEMCYMLATEMTLTCCHTHAKNNFYKAIRLPFSITMLAVPSYDQTKNIFLVKSTSLAPQC